MHLLIPIVLLLFNVSVCAAADVALPWEELKQLYREKILREMTAAPDEETPVYSLASAHYHLKITADTAHGTMKLNGAVLSGKVDQILIFSGPLAIQKIDHVAGGHLVVDPTPTPRVFFRPSGIEPFEIHLAFLAPVRERRDGRIVEVPIPTALKNTLQIESAGDVELIDVPGIRNPQGLYHFTTRGLLQVRFGDAQMVARHRRPLIDMLSEIAFRDDRLRIRCLLTAPRGFPESFRMVVPPGFGFVGAAEDRIGVSVHPDRSLSVRPQHPDARVLALLFAEDSALPRDATTLRLPRILENEGLEGHFTLASPDNALLTLEAGDAYLPVSAARLPTGLRAVAAGTDRVFKTAAQTPVKIRIQILAPAAAAPLVLDRITYFAAFEENGSNLAVMVLELPAQAGAHLAIQAVPGADIWSLKVNGTHREVYTDPQGQWLVPLPAGEPARIALAILRKGPRLKLSGRLKLQVPALGFACRELQIGIALPARVELTSLEGPASPAPGGVPDPPKEFVGQPYYFQRAFYPGDGMNLAFMYREPAQPIP